MPSATGVELQPGAGLKEKLEAARQLRIGRATLHDKLKKYGLGEGSA